MLDIVRWTSVVFFICFFECIENEQNKDHIGNGFHNNSFECTFHSMCGDGSAMTWNAGSHEMCYLSRPTFLLLRHTHKRMYKVDRFKWFNLLSQVNTGWFIGFVTLNISKYFSSLFHNPLVSFRCSIEFSTENEK